MRLVKVKVPEGEGQKVAKIAFDLGIAQVSLRNETSQARDGSQLVKDVVEIDADTPTAKRFLDALTVAPFFDCGVCSIDVRQPRSVISREPVSRVTWPLAEPAIDVFEELWQFSHVTPGFIGRLFIAGCLLSYGLIQNNLLLIISGLMFAPFLPALLAVGFGLLTLKWKLVAHSACALAAGLALIAAAGAGVAFLTGFQPVRFDAFEPTGVGVLISFAVGIAAALANADDAGRRELIGLAAAAQVATIPAWFGICLVSGFPGDIPPSHRALTLLANAATFILASLATQAAVGFRSSTLRAIKE